MKVTIRPVSRLGIWSIGLHTFFLIVIISSIILVKGIKILSFNDTWWDLTVPVSFTASIIAFITGLRALIKSKDRSILVFLSLVIGLCVILFIFLHSLFIND